ncbi:hypothetical protein LNQ81_13405 [Myroides sp. M-43]|uniref:hypothetical protein n=1 Tax=Myroides oncorhynchi TaxID=2893756 RepID=UPI001E3B422D|nr:hypothetical protein [Myroides oncorhynchi]MCC9043669.1 hypothetical protein [Myroides oncorhynchi]
MKKCLLIGLMLVGTNLGMSYGQTVIGGGKLPAEGAILDLKDMVVGADNVAASKGFLMPRVMLTDLTKLIPLVKTETPENKKEHIGLQVYHVGGATSTISPGLKIWNGVNWEELYSSPKGQWIYMPPFPLKMYLDAVQTIDLYAEYSKQIKDKATLWQPNDVTFIITGFDALAFATAPLIQTDISGAIHKHNLVFKPALGKLTASSYLNIIIVKK